MCGGDADCFHGVNTDRRTEVLPGFGGLTGILWEVRGLGGQASQVWLVDSNIMGSHERQEQEWGSLCTPVTHVSGLESKCVFG